MINNCSDYTKSSDNNNDYKMMITMIILIIKMT